MPTDVSPSRQTWPRPRRGGLGWALAAALLLGAALAGFFASGTHRVFTERDDGYIGASRHTSIEGMLSDRRTFVYPTLLRAVALVSGDYALLPYVQAAIFLAAAAFLLWALLRVGWPPWIALLAVAPLGASELLTPFARRILTECVAGGAAVVVVALLLLLLHERRPRWWIALGVFVFLTYQIRPTYVVLVPLVPAVLAWAAWRARKSLAASGSWWRTGLKAALLTAVPFLAFCALRWWVVGHFGLVSFGGYNVIGVASSMLSPHVVSQIPQPLKPLAREMLAERRSRGLAPIDERRFGREKARYRAWYAEYNPNILEATRKVVLPYTVERYRERRQALLAERETVERNSAGAERPRRLAAIDRELAELGTRQHYSRRETNRLFTELARTILRLRAPLYADWISFGLRQGVVWTFERVRGVAWALFAALAALIALMLVMARLPSEKRASLRAAVAHGWRRAAPLVWVAAGLYSSMLLLVVLVEPPIERYLLSAAVLVPSALAALAGELGLALVRALGETRAVRPPS